MGNYLKKPIIDEAVQSGRLGTINYASNTIQVSNVEFGLDLGMDEVGGIFGTLQFATLNTWYRLPLELIDYSL